MSLSLPLTELASSLRRGELALHDYLDALFARIEAREPDVLAFVDEPDRFGRIRAEAGALLARYPDPEMRPPLFGVPVGVKDIFHAVGFETRAGSKLPPNVLWPAGTPASAVVRELKRFGALILGKTVTTEFAHFAPGPTRNPHNLAHTPGGSSSGSAAAVAAGMAPLALGTQTIGSVVRPAAFCGVVGFKPSRGRVSREGVIPLSPSLDHVGWFATEVEAMTLVADILLEGWHPLPELHAPVLGVPDGPYLAHASAEGLARFEADVARLQAAGYEVRRVGAFSDFDVWQRRHVLVESYDAAQVHKYWFAGYGELYHERTRALLREGQTVSEAVYRREKQAMGEAGRVMLNQMADAGIDLWIAPPAPGAAPAGIDSTGDPVMNLPWTQIGFPALNIPSGTNSSGLPLGLQVVARLGQDEHLLTWAKDIEAALAR